MKRILISGAPTGAAGNCPGMEFAPAHLRTNGITKSFQMAGIDVKDFGDLPFRPFVIDSSHPTTRNVASVTAAAFDAKRRTIEFISQDTPFLLLGGDCSISVGVVAAFREAGRNFGVLYVDGHTDLNDPETWYSGIMDGMGVAHMYGLGHEDLMALCEARPMLNAEQLTFLGYDPVRQYEAEAKHLSNLGCLAIPVTELLNDVRAATDKAVNSLAAFDSMVVHLDIDVLHFPDFPYAHVPDYRGTGIQFSDLREILTTAFKSSNFAGCVLTEINPDRDRDGVFARKLISMLVEAWEGSM